MTTITLQIATKNEAGQIEFSTVGGSYKTRKQAMIAAKKVAGRGATYAGDGLSVRYSGQNGTVYLVEAQ